MNNSVLDNILFTPSMYMRTVHKGHKLYRKGESLSPKKKSEFNTDIVTHDEGVNNLHKLVKLRLSNI